MVTLPNVISGFYKLLAGWLLGLATIVFLRDSDPLSVGVLLVGSLLVLLINYWVDLERPI